MPRVSPASPGGTLELEDWQHDGALAAAKVDVILWPGAAKDGWLIIPRSKTCSKGEYSYVTPKGEHLANRLLALNVGQGWQEEDYETDVAFVWSADAAAHAAELLQLSLIHI